jgi:uncharacterized protein YegL
MATVGSFVGNLNEEGEEGAHMDTDLYTQPATTLTPALVVYLIDTSDSMNQPCGATTKIDLVNTALRESIRHMIRRSMRDGIPQPQYHVAILSYNTHVIDMLNGIRNLPDLVQAGVPKLVAQGETDMTAGFASVEKLLQNYQASLQRSASLRRPAPLVCHLTDAHFTTDDPSPFVKRILRMRFSDGPVLVEHVYMAEDMLRQPVQDWYRWGGIHKLNEITNEHARRLFYLTSPLPEVYRQNINNYGYQLQKGALLFFPGTHYELVKLAFAISAGTQLR